MGMAVIALLLFISLISLYFICQYVQLSNSISKIKYDIDTAAKLIDYQEDGAENFYRDYEEINASFKDIHFIAHAWQEFTEHIIFDKNAAGELVVKNSIQPSSYFSVDKLLTTNTEIKRSNHVTWSLLGFGAIGAAIVFILAMVSTSVVPDQALILMKIAKNASYALVCFAAGLGYALAFAMLQKTDIIHIEDKLHEFNDNLENVLIFSTTNQVLDEVLNALVEQNKKVDGISNSIALSGNNFSEANSVREQKNGELLHKLTENFSDKLQQLVEQGQSTAEVLTELQKYVSEHSQSFSDNLWQRLNEQGERTVGTLTKLKQQQAEHSQSFSDKLQYLSTELGQLVVETLAELKQHSSTNADKFYDKLQQLFVQQEQHTTIALERLRASNVANTEKLYNKLGEIPAEQEQFDYEVQATIKKQPREDRLPEEPDPEGPEAIAAKKLENGEVPSENESSEIDNLIPFGLEP